MKKLEGGGDSNPADNFRIKANETFYMILTYNWWERVSTALSLIAELLFKC